MGWSGGAMVLGKLPVPGRPTIWMIVGKGPISLAVVRVGLFGHFYSSLSFPSSFSLSLGFYGDVMLLKDGDEWQTVKTLVRLLLQQK